MLRNSTNTLKVFAFNHNTAHPQTGDAANITCKVSLDGAAAVALADTNPTEMEDGYYLFNVTAAESNGVTADFFPESTTNNVQVICAEHNRYLLPQGGVATLSNQNSIISALSGAGVTLVSPVTDLGNLVLYNGRTYGGSAHGAITFTVAKNYTSATYVELVLFELGDPATELQTLSGTVASSTSITASGTINVSGDYSGEIAVLTTGYTLQASWSGSMETIATGRAFVYKQPS